MARRTCSSTVLFPMLRISPISQADLPRATQPRTSISRRVRADNSNVLYSDFRRLVIAHRGRKFGTVIFTDVPRWRIIAKARALAHHLPARLDRIGHSKRWLLITTRPSVELLLADLAACQTEDGIIMWAAKVKDPGLPELYAAMLDKFADLRETAANQNRPPKD